MGNMTVDSTSSYCGTDDSTSTLDALHRESYTAAATSGDDQVTSDKQRIQEQIQEDYHRVHVYGRGRSSNKKVNDNENVANQPRNCSPWLEIGLGVFVFLVLLGLLTDLFVSAMMHEMNSLNEDGAPVDFSSLWASAGVSTTVASEQ